VFDDDQIHRVETTTRAIRVQATPIFLDGQSSPADHRYIWAYDIEIENLGPETVQLLNRRWQITNARGETEAVEGAGVIGKQPVLSPGGKFRYQSGTPLSTPSGLMRGEYEMENERGERFWITVPAFSLDSPYETGALN